MCSLYLQMNIHPVCITSTHHTAYATIDTVIIHHVYKPDFSSLRSYFLDRKLGPVCHQIGDRVRSSFLVPRPRVEIYSQSFQYPGPIIYNDFSFLPGQHLRIPRCK